MSYSRLYDFCQTLTPHIHRNNIRDKVKELAGVPSLRVAKTALNVELCRGFYLSGRNKSHPLVQQFGCHLIVLPREGLNRCEERFVFVKELMHIFDSPLEATDTGDAFERLLSEFIAPNTKEHSPQMTSEIKCFWMALGALCPEENRKKFKAERDKSQIDDYSIALKLRIPQAYISHLFIPKFEELINLLINPQNT